MPGSLVGTQPWDELKISFYLLQSTIKFCSQTFPAEKQKTANCSAQLLHCWYGQCAQDGSACAHRWKHHKVHTGPLLKPVKVPLNDILSLGHVSCTNQLCVICKPAEHALSLTVSLMKISQVPIQILEGNHLSQISIWRSSYWPLPSACSSPANSLTTQQATHQICISPSCGGPS